LGFFDARKVRVNLKSEKNALGVFDGTSPVMGIFHSASPDEQNREGVGYPPPILIFSTVED